MPRLSIIIPCKNEEANLPKLLASIKQQTFTDYEVIVADAHSTDRTREFAERAGARVVEGGMPGPGRNAGALHAKGEYLLFLDADVILPSHEYLAVVIREFDAKKADIATCTVIPLSENPVDHVFHGMYNVYVKATERVRPHAPGFCILVKRVTHEGIKGFDEDVVFAEDMDYAQRAAKGGNKFRVINQPIAASVRRFEKDGRLGIAIKYVFAELRMMFKGPFKNEIPFEYEMGGEAQGRKSVRASGRKGTKTK
jgi:glycosyltransferase involved in cell wall biosynthesis